MAVSIFGVGFVKVSERSSMGVFVFMTFAILGDILP
jgi:hypothetical protein